MLNYKSEILELDPVINREGLIQIYPDGIIPKKDASGIVNTLIDSAYVQIDAMIEKVNERFDSDAIGIAVVVTKSKLDDEFAELRKDVDDRLKDSTFDEMQDFLDKTAEYLMVLADLVLGPPQWDNPVFVALFRKWFPKQA